MEHGQPSRSHTLKENGFFLPRSQLTIAPHLGLGLVSPSTLHAVLARSCAYFIQANIAPMCSWMQCSEVSRGHFSSLIFCTHCVASDWTWAFIHATHLLDSSSMPPAPFKDKFILLYSLIHGHLFVFRGMFSLFHSVVHGNLELLGSLGYLKPYSTAFEWT